MLRTLHYAFAGTGSTGQVRTVSLHQLAQLVSIAQTLEQPCRVPETRLPRRGALGWANVRAETSNFSISMASVFLKADVQYIATAQAAQSRYAAAYI